MKVFLGLARIALVTTATVFAGVLLLSDAKPAFSKGSGYTSDYALTWGWVWRPSGCSWQCNHQDIHI